jgi:hypothetical protein
MDDEEKLREAFSVRPNGITFSLERATLTLLSLFIADKEIQTLYSKYDLSHMEMWHGEVKEAMIVELLVEIATRYRIMEWGTKDERPKDFVNEIVGGMHSSKTETEIELSMHEACNKIIHANKFEFDVSRLENSKNHYYFNPNVYTYGTKGKEEWVAMIDIVLFCNAANQSLEDPFGIGF